MKVIILSLFFIFISCNGQKKVSDKNLKLSDKLELVLKDNYSGISTPEIQIIKEPSTLKSFFSKINRTRKPGLAIPKIDFTKEMIVVLCSGEQTIKKTTSLELKQESNSQLIIKVREEKNTSKMGTTVVTAPFYLYKMPLTDKKITFEKG